MSITRTARVHVLGLTGASTLARYRQIVSCKMSPRGMPLNEKKSPELSNDSGTVFTSSLVLGESVLVRQFPSTYLPTSLEHNDFEGLKKPRRKASWVDSEMRYAEARYDEMRCEI